jgi:hypothetical protein
VTNLEQYQPQVDTNRHWQVSDLDLDLIAVGAQILGAGGGGSAWHNRLKLQHAMTSVPGGVGAALRTGTSPVPPQELASSGTSAAPSSTTASNTTTTTTTSSSSSSSSSSSRRRCPVIISLQDLSDTANTCDVGGMGAPTVSAEKLDSNEGAAAVEALSQVRQPTCSAPPTITWGTT